MARKTNTRWKKRDFRGDEGDYLMHPTKGHRRLRLHQRAVKAQGEAKLAWFKRMGKPKDGEAQS